MNTPYFLTICLNPVLQKTIVVPRFKENRVNRSREYYLDAAGKGVIVSRVLRQCNENVFHLTQAGGRNKNLFLDMLSGENIPVRWEDSGSEIRFCYTLFNKENHSSTEIVEEAVAVAPDTENRIKKSFTELLPESHTVIISGTKAAGFSEDLYPGMAQEAKKMEKLVLLDYRGADLKNSLIYSPDIIKPNYDEFIQTFFPEHQEATDINKNELIEKIHEKIISIWKDFGISTILTHESKSVLYIENGKILSIEPIRITPLNTTGCGDAFTAGFALEYNRGRDMSKAVRRGLDYAKRNALTLRPGYLL